MFAMNAMATEESDDWGDISDAELLSIESEHLATAERRSKEDDAQSPSEGRLDVSTSRPDLVQGAASSDCRKRLFAQPQSFRNRSIGLSVPNQSPMQRFYKRHLSVTLLCDQSWCEIKMAYGFIKPQVRRREMQRREVTTGASIHLAREMEVNQEVVSVAAVTREDREALKLLNVLLMVSALQAGERVREFPVFGVLEGMFLMGVVDELCRGESGELILSELKTRSHHSLPGLSQAKGHTLQVGLYKLLFDSMVGGQVKREQLLQHLQLRPQQALGMAVQDHAKTLGLQTTTFGELLDHFLLILTLSDVGRVDKLCVEYNHQSSGGLIGTRDVEFEEAQLRAVVSGYLAYWRGERDPQGVDIEDAWKCTMCPYQEICDWRNSRSEEAVAANSNKRVRLDSPNFSGLNMDCPNTPKSP